MATVSSMSSKSSLAFSTFSPGATDFLGNGAIMLDYKLFVPDSLQQTY